MSANNTTYNEPSRSPSLLQQQVLQQQRKRAGAATGKAGAATGKAGAPLPPPKRKSSDQAALHNNNKNVSLARASSTRVQGRGHSGNSINNNNKRRTVNVPSPHTPSAPTLPHGGVYTPLTYATPVTKAAANVSTTCTVMFSVNGLLVSKA